MPSRRSSRHRTDANRRRRVAFFVLPLGAEPEDESTDYSGRVWHERAHTDLEVVPLDAPPPDPMQLDLPLS